MAIGYYNKGACPSTTWPSVCNARSIVSSVGSGSAQRQRLVAADS